MVKINLEHNDKSSQGRDKQVTAIAIGGLGVFLGGLLTYIGAEMNSEKVILFGFGLIFFVLIFISIPMYLVGRTDEWINRRDRR